MHQALAGSDTTSKQALQSRSASCGKLHINHRNWSAIVEAVGDGCWAPCRANCAEIKSVVCARRDVFKAGASLYGVADLELLAQDTHKFESRYLDGLIGPYPEKKDVYVARSPIHAIDKFDQPIAFFQVSTGILRVWPGV